MRALLLGLIIAIPALAQTSHNEVQSGINRAVQDMRASGCVSPTWSRTGRYTLSTLDATTKVLSGDTFAITITCTPQATPPQEYSILVTWDHAQPETVSGYLLNGEAIGNVNSFQIDNLQPGEYNISLIAVGLTGLQSTPVVVEVVL